MFRDLKKIPTDPEQRRLLMRHMVQLQMEKRKAHENLDKVAIAIAQFLGTLNSLVADFLTSCPPAALALSGLCVAANVGDPYPSGLFLAPALLPS